MDVQEGVTYKTRSGLKAGPAIFSMGHWQLSIDSGPNNGYRSNGKWGCNSVHDDIKPHLDLVGVWGEPVQEQEYKTLKELDVQVGDVVKHSGGLTYTVKEGRCLYGHTSKSNFNYTSLWGVSDCFYVSSRAEQIPFGNLSPEEKGVLLLARHEGKEIECLQWSQNVWLVIADPQFDDRSAYRIAAPKPFVESLKMTSPLHFKGGRSLNKKEYNITVQFTDGVPDVETIKMEKIHD